jgi:hypothetical protein
VSTLTSHRTLAVVTRMRVAVEIKGWWPASVLMLAGLAPSRASPLLQGGCGELAGIVWLRCLSGFGGSFSIGGGWAGAIASRLAPTEGFVW